MQQLREATVSVILEVRRAYLANGASPLKHWEQIHGRVRSAARTTTSVEEWTTRLLRSLGIQSPGKSLSSEMVRLQHTVDEFGGPRAWLDLVGREHAYMMAMARIDAENRKAARAALETE